MNIPLTQLVRPAVALLVGGVVGLGFGTIQDAARRRHQKLQDAGKFNSGMAAIPGSFRRVAYLLVALALMQFLCPILFSPDSISQWFVSAGVVIGYGWILFGQLRSRQA